ncbi:MAG: hypothetical protein ABI318_08885 [Chthoniobacteraceae bacterium]
MNIRLNTTTLAGFFAIVGGLGSVLLKWAWGFYMAVGVNVPFAGAAGVIFLCLLLYLIATGPLEPPPVWRPVGTVLFAIGTGVLFLVYAYGPGGNWVNSPEPWVMILSTLAVLITATIELHGVFARRAK